MNNDKKKDLYNDSIISDQLIIIIIFFGRIKMVKEKSIENDGEEKMNLVI